MVFPTSVCESTIVSAPEAALEDLLWKWCRCLDGRGPGSTGCARELVLTGAAGMELVVVHLLSHVWLFATPWTSACQASLSITISQSLLKLTFIKLVMPSSRLGLCCPLLFLPSIFPSIRVFSNESVLLIKWPKDWSFSISPSNEYSELISFRIC